jgi:hypothetical protein
MTEVFLQNKIDCSLDRIRHHNQGSCRVLLRARERDTGRVIDLQITTLAAVRKGFHAPQLRLREHFVIHLWEYWTELI